MRKRKTWFGSSEAIEGKIADLQEGGCKHCAHCASTGLMNIWNVIQYGFVEDKTIEYYLCPACAKFTFVEYRTIVEITEVTAQKLRGDNGN